MKKFLDWLIDTWLYNYLVSHADYDLVQQRLQSQEGYITHLHEELKEAYDSCYTKFGKPFEEFGEQVKAEFIETNRIDLRELNFTYTFRIPHKQYYTLRDPTSWFQKTKEVVIDRLTDAFRGHMQKNLFRDL